MRNQNEMQFVDTNDQPLQPSANQNYSPVPNYSPNDGSSSSRFINTRMVRIRYGTKCEMRECRTNKPFYQINTIFAIDDNNPQNENEGPLFEAELAIPKCCPQPPQFNIYEAQSKQAYALCRFDGFPIDHYACCCCGERYAELPNMISNKIGNEIDISTTKCYDTRSFYRTFEYQGKAYYKIGKPYVKEDSCCCCKKKEDIKDEPCCSCCAKKEIVKRIYVDIFNMSDQCVGKFVRFFDQTGCCCCVKTTEFFEVYFPSDANEMLKISLLGHFLFLNFVLEPFLWILPGKKEDLASFA